MATSIKQQHKQVGYRVLDQICKTLLANSKTSSSQNMQIDGLSWVGASWERSLELAEMEYDLWKPKK